MKKSILLSLSIGIFICYANAQPPENNRGENLQRPRNDSSFHRFQHNKPPFQEGGANRHQDPFAKGKPGSFEGKKRGPLAGLHLTPDQMKQVKVMNENFRAQVASLEKSDKISLGEYKTQLASLHKAHKAQFEALLTDEQKKQIADQKKNAAINQQVKTVAQLERMRLTLGLTDEQLAKIKANQTALHNKLVALHENEALLPEQKRAALTSLMNERKELLKSILTPEQQLKADSLRKNMPQNSRNGWHNNNRPPIAK